MCFAAGTLLWTPQGCRAIEDIRAGEVVFSRDQWDEAGAVEAKVVEEVFARFAGVLHLHLPNGAVIRTTHEHPFFVAGKGWTPANQLRPGDRLVCADRTTVAVEEVFDTGEWEAVYNLRVADHHTYFVGEDGWGFEVWSHNACDPEIVQFRKDKKLPYGELQNTDPNDSEYRATVAKVVVGGTRYYGVNYRANGVGSLPSCKLPDAARTASIKRLRDEGNWNGDRDPQFFRHAEFTTLYLAAGGFDEDMKPVRTLPKKLAMDADRKLCTFGDGCAKNLHSVLDWFGIEELYIRDSHDIVMKITKASLEAEVLPVTYDLAAWAAFKTQNRM